MTDSRPETTDSDDIDVGKILHLALERWLFFIVSIVVCGIGSYAYIWYVHPQYEMSATIMVQDQGNDISKNILDEVGVVGKNRNIENEIAILSSRSLITEAVSSLDLNMNYIIDYGYKTRDLYQNSPIELKHDLVAGAPASLSFSVSILNGDEKAIITRKVRRSGNVVETSQEVEFGLPFDNELGTFTLVKTDQFASLAGGDSASSKQYEIIYWSDDVLTTVYQSRLTVQEAREKSSILLLILQDKVAKRGEDVLNAILNVFIQNNIEKKNQLASNSLKFIDTQLEVISDDLNTLEADIKKFKSTNRITDVSSEASFFLEQVGVLDKLVSEIDVKLSIIQYLEEYIAADKDLNNASPSSLGLDDPLLNQLISALNRLSAERESQLRFTTKENPIIAGIDLEIEETKASLKKNTASIRKSLIASKDEIQSQLKTVESKVNTLPKAEYELLALERQYSIKEGLYLLLLEKKSDNSILLASTISDNVIIDKARSSEGPVSPKKNRIYLMGMVIGIGIPAIYVFLILLLDARIKDTDDLKRASNIPFLGIIPHHNETGYVVVENNKNSAIAESFRSVRTNLSFMVNAASEESAVNPKIVQLTSAMGSEGKSFCSINLGASLALSAGKTIVVGLDLRKPKLAEYFHCSNDIGASSVLAGLNTLDEAILQTKIENLDVLVGGPIPPNPSELLMGKSMSDMLTELSNSYDHVILDTPPIGLVTDSLIISEHAATTIYVVRQNITTTKGLSYINDLYNSRKIKSVSLLFNDVKSSRFGYGYGYGYGYGNGYYSESVNPTPFEKFKRLLKIS